MKSVDDTYMYTIDLIVVNELQGAVSRFVAHQPPNIYMCVCVVSIYWFQFSRVSALRICQKMVSLKGRLLCFCILQKVLLL